MSCETTVKLKIHFKHNRNHCKKFFNKYPVREVQETPMTVKGVIPEIVRERGT